jgi:hypothetical protein
MEDHRRLVVDLDEDTDHDEERKQPDLTIEG